MGENGKREKGFWSGERQLIYLTFAIILLGMFCDCCGYDDHPLEACRSWWHHPRGVRGKYNLDPAVV